jgi:hypothetical protein
MRIFGRSAPAAFALLTGCGDAQCVYYPCPEFEAITLSVTNGTGAATLPGLTLTIAGAELGTAPCDSIARVCHVLGGAGNYQLTVSATGYAPATASVTITGEGAGCNTCGRVDRQELAVTLQPL